MNEWLKERRKEKRVVKKERLRALYCMAVREFGAEKKIATLAKH